MDAPRIAASIALIAWTWERFGHYRFQNIVIKVRCQVSLIGHNACVQVLQAKLGHICRQQAQLVLIYLPSYSGSV